VDGVYFCTSLSLPSGVVNCSDLRCLKILPFCIFKMSQLYREVQSIMNDCYMICSETGVRAVEQAVQQISPQQTKPLEETNSDASVLSAVLARNVSLSEDDLKNADTFDVSVSYVQLHSQSYSSIAISRKYLDFYAQTHMICI